MRHIRLTRGRQTIVDDDDFERFGHLTWHTDWFGYAKRKCPQTKKTLYLHNEVLGVRAGSGVDHIDRNKLNNTKTNLRIVSQSANGQNKDADGRNTSGYKGVLFHSPNRGYRATITKDRRALNLGYFLDKDDAARAYNKAALTIYGPQAFQNVIKRTPFSWRTPDYNKQNHTTTPSTMPKTYETSFLDHDCVIMGPSTIAEIESVIGVDATLESVVRSLLYRTVAPKVRDRYFALIEEAYSIKLEPEEAAVPASNGTPGRPAKWPTDKKCQRQLADKAKIAPEAINATFQPFMDQACEELDFEQALRAVRSDSGKIGQEWLSMADTVLAGINEKRGGDPTKFLENMRNLLPTASLPDEFGREDIARLLKRFHDAQKKSGAADLA